MVFLSDSPDTLLQCFLFLRREASWHLLTAWHSIDAVLLKMCLRISCVVIKCSVVSAHSHLLKTRLKLLSLLAETLIGVAYKTLGLSPRDIHRVRIVLGRLMLLVP
jgi:hypothetical protein